MEQQPGDEKRMPPPGTPVNIRTYVQHKAREVPTAEVLYEDISVEEFPNFIRTMVRAETLTPGTSVDDKCNDDYALLGDAARQVQEELSNTVTYKTLSPVCVANAAIKHVPGKKLVVSLSFQSKLHEGEKAKDFHEIRRKIEMCEDGRRQISTKFWIDSECLQVDMRHFDDYAPDEILDFTKEHQLSKSIYPLMELVNANGECMQDTLARAFDTIYTMALGVQRYLKRANNIVVDVNKDTEQVRRAWLDGGSLTKGINTIRDLFNEIHVQDPENFMAKSISMICSAMSMIIAYENVPANLATKNSSVLDLLRVLAFASQLCAAHGARQEHMLASALVLQLVEVLFEEVVTVMRNHMRRCGSKKALKAFQLFKDSWVSTYVNNYILATFSIHGFDYVEGLKAEKLSFVKFVTFLEFLLNEVIGCIDISEALFHFMSASAERGYQFGFFVQETSDSQNVPVRFVSVNSVTFFTLDHPCNTMGMAIALDRVDPEFWDNRISRQHNTAMLDHTGIPTNFLTYVKYKTFSDPDILLEKEVEPPADLFEDESPAKTNAKKVDKRKQEKQRQKERKREALAREDAEKKAEEEARLEYLRKKKEKESNKRNMKKQKKAAEVRVLLNTSPSLQDPAIIMVQPEKEEEEELMLSPLDPAIIMVQPEKEEEEELMLSPVTPPVPCIGPLDSGATPSPIFCNRASPGKIHHGLGGLCVDIEGMLPWPEGDLDSQIIAAMSTPDTVVHPTEPTGGADDSDFALFTPRKKRADKRAAERCGSKPRGVRSTRTLTKKNLQSIIFRHLARKASLNNTTGESMQCINAIVRVQAKQYTNDIMAGRELPPNLPLNVHRYIQKVPIEFFGWSEPLVWTGGPEASPQHGLDVYPALPHFTAHTDASNTSISSIDADDDKHSDDLDVLNFMFAEAGMFFHECTFCLDKATTHCVPECGHAVYCADCMHKNRYRKCCPICLTENKGNDHTIKISEARSRGINIYYC